MKGIMFNLVEEVVIRHHGEDIWDRLLDESGLGGAYTSMGSYPDDDALLLLDVAAGALGSTRAEVLRWFGREAIPVLAGRYPDYFRGHHDSRSFVLRVNDVIHPEVGKIYPGADVPALSFSDEPDGSLMMAYGSRRKLCALAQGLIEGAADRFGQTLAFEHLSCMHDGDAVCLCRITLNDPIPA